MKAKFFKNSIVTLLVVTIVMSIMSMTFSVQAATQVRTGRFGSGNNYVGTVVLLKDKKGNLQDARIKVCSFGKKALSNEKGTLNKAKLHITLRDTNGRWICEFDTTSTSTLKLGKDHNAYKVYIRPATIKNTAEDWKNAGACYYWSVDAVKNCDIR